MQPARTRSIALALLAAGVSACSSATAGAPAPAAQPGAGGGDDVREVAPAAAVGVYPHTEADVHFMSAMIGHHAQALEMSRMAPTHGASPAVRTLAARIFNSQQDEIATMQRWLRDRGAPVPEVQATGAMAAHGAGHDGHAAHAAAMSGMLTPAQMQQLDAARGAEFDRLFLTFMIQHHRGAVTMVDELVGSYGAAQDPSVFKIASDINADQTTEIARMQRMLASQVLGIDAP